MKLFITILKILSLQALLATAWPEFYIFRQTGYDIVTSQRLYLIDHRLPTVIFIHGFNDNGRETKLIKIIKELIKKENQNYIMIDWQEGATGPDYLNAVSNLADLGKRIADFMLIADIRPSRTTCIGHSLGAHACGCVGRIRKLKRISALDPAGPLFYGNSIYRLNISDANYVDVIHTDNVLGYSSPLGHKDFYPNGGSTQLGCMTLIRKRAVQKSSKDWYPIVHAILSSQLGCSHERSIHYYAESVNSNCRFKSSLCTNLENYNQGNCECGNCGIMGYYSDLYGPNGNYYLATSSKEPFCLDSKLF